MDFNTLRDKVIDLEETRDWKKSHTPKNLAMNIMIEAGELGEIFVWMTQQQSNDIKTDKEYHHAQQELGDIFINVILMAEKLGVDLFKITDEKIEEIKSRYPEK